MADPNSMNGGWLWLSLCSPKRQWGSSVRVRSNPPFYSCSSSRVGRSSWSSPLPPRSRGFPSPPSTGGSRTGAGVHRQRALVLALTEARCAETLRAAIDRLRVRDVRGGAVGFAAPSDKEGAALHNFSPACHGDFLHFTFAFHCSRFAQLLALLVFALLSSARV